MGVDAAADRTSRGNPAKRRGLELVKTINQLVREFWLPFILASIWTAYVTLSGSTHPTIAAAISNFGGAFFLMSWATGQFIRVRRQSHVESNLQSIQTRLEAVLSQVEIRTTELLNQITGGDSFCYLQFTMFNYDQNTALLMAIHKGLHPIYDVHARMVDLDRMHEARLTGTSPFSFDTNLDVPTLMPNKATGLQPFLVGTATERRFNIFWTARNGDWVQLLRLAKVNGLWQWAIRVKRGQSIIFEQISADFPAGSLDPEWKGEETA